ncbi:MAG: stalk domain-containing protein [Cellulosilyticaceae bacterium]
MNKNSIKIIALSSALVIGTGAVSLNAASLTKSIQARYNNIRVTLDGAEKSVPSDREPFIYDDRTYIAVADVANLSGLTAIWNSSKQTVELSTKPSANVADLTLQLANKTAELESTKNKLTTAETKITASETKISELEKELATVKAALEKYENDPSNPNTEVLPDITNSDLSDMVDELTYKFDDDLDIDWTFDLSADQKEGVLELAASFKRVDLSGFILVDDEDLEAFISDMSKMIRKEFGKVGIVGEIIGNNETLTNFSVTSAGVVTLEHQNSTVHMNRINALISDYFKKLTSFSGFSTNILVEDIDVSVAKNYRSATATVSVDLTKANDQEKWNTFCDNVSTRTKRSIEKELSDISGYVSDYFNMSDDKVAVTIYADDTYLASYDDYGLELREWK